MRRTAVVGAGMAGLAAALALSKQGVHVTVFDAAPRLGGKCGAEYDGTSFNEHAFHLFGMWYVNFWEMVADLGLDSSFEDHPVHRFLDAGSFPTTTYLRNFASGRTFFRNVMSRAVLPRAEMFLYMYSMLDLASQPFRRRSFLDQQSVNGFMRSRFYSTDRIAREHQDILYKTFSVPSYRISAFSYQKMLTYWLASPTPTMRMMTSDVHTGLISPIQDRLRSVGCEIRLEHRLTRLELQDGRIERLHFTDGDGSEHAETVDEVIMAIPVERLAEVLDDDLFDAAPELFSVLELDASPMYALSVYFKTKRDDMPSEITILRDSEYGLSFRG